MFRKHERESRICDNGAGYLFDSFTVEKSPMIHDTIIWEVVSSDPSQSSDSCGLVASSDMSSSSRDWGIARVSWVWSWVWSVLRRISTGCQKHQHINSIFKDQSYHINEKAFNCRLFDWHRSLTGLLKTRRVMFLIFRPFSRCAACGCTLRRKSKSIFKSKIPFHIVYMKQTGGIYSALKPAKMGIS